MQVNLEDLPGPPALLSTRQEEEQLLMHAQVAVGQAARCQGTEEGRMWDGRAGRGRARQGGAGQGVAGQGVAGQSKAGQGEAILKAGDVEHTSGLRLTLGDC